MRRKLKCSKTPSDQERIHALEERLDAACEEHRRLRAEMDALQQRDPLDPLRAALRAQERRQPAVAIDRNRRRQLSQPSSLDVSFDPHETIN